MEELKRQEIYILAESKIAEYSDLIDLAKDITNGYIFGKYANNEHYNIDDIYSIVQEVSQNIPYTPPHAEITDEQVINKLIEEGIVTQEAVNAIVEELTPDIVGKENVEVGTFSIPAEEIPQ